MATRDWLYTIVKYTTGGLLIGAVGVGGLLYGFQTKLIYPAGIPAGSRTVVATPDEFDMAFEDVRLRTPDGIQLRAYLMLQTDEPSRKPTVLLLHANAGNVGHRLPIAKVFYKSMKCNVLALSYRGYGLSEGAPNEQGLMLDAQTALDYILSHPSLDKTEIFLYGQSIGGAVAIFLASQNKTRVRGLIVENTFLSLPKLVPHIIPFVKPFLFLLHQIWPSEARISTLPSDFPVLFLAGEQDELVLPSHMVALYSLCPSERKCWRSFPHGTHNDTCVQPHYFEHVASFIGENPGSTSTEKAADSPTDEQEPTSEPKSPSSASTNGNSSDSAESFELVDQADADLEVVEDKQHNREIKDEGGALSVNPIEAVLKEKL